MPCAARLAAVLMSRPLNPGYPGKVAYSQLSTREAGADLARLAKTALTRATHTSGDDRSSRTRITAQPGIISKRLKGTGPRRVAPGDRPPAMNGSP